MRVLLVDDSGVQLEALAYLLQGRGHDVYTAANGLAALSKLAVHLPDVVVVDLVMPALDGRGLIERLRSEERTRHLPVVAITALPPGDHGLSVLPGDVTLLRKPFEVPELEEALARALEGGMPC
jgi:CheY-like chemotaxis protein